MRALLGILVPISVVTVVACSSNPQVIQPGSQRQGTGSGGASSTQGSGGKGSDTFLFEGGVRAEDGGVVSMEASAPALCGDGTVGNGEQCDDGNTKAGDGCSATCLVEPGFTCTEAAKPCTRIEYCGDGVVSLDIGEQCDDGNTTAGDGCGATCQLEADFVCPTAGKACVSTIRCGDGVIGGTEQCDDGNTAAGDGCGATCQLEKGWNCPDPGSLCAAAACGDGIVAGIEQCDDGGTKPNDGCSATCRIEPGFACTTAAPTVCHATTCGDGVKEGSEQCDDGNLIPYDGCSPTCTKESACQDGTCSAVCGDGLKFPQEKCDDGNTTSGDGCSSTCQLEPGFSCTVSTLNPPASLDIPILYRDMLYRGTTTPGTGHPDFQWNNAGATGLVMSTLGADGLPVFASSTGSGTTPLITDATSFYWWYHETQGTTTNPYDKLVYLDKSGKPTTLTLGQLSSGVYQFSSTTFFPVDGLGWNAGASPQTDLGHDNVEHNFSFTSELHYPFTYQGGEVLDFYGDDDVYVFINGHLAVDLGGVHGRLDGNVTLDETTEGPKLGLAKGGMYEIAVFQAERHTAGSNYQLTLSGFVHAVSECTSVCGDGIVTAGEVCDDGVNDGSYGGCMPGCKARGPHCGDDKVQSPEEQCDNGVNLVTYGGTTQQCGPGCKWSGYCGDGVISNGEQCDDGASNGTGYGHCTAQCTLGPRCGDGIVNGPEKCDEGAKNKPGAIAYGKGVCTSTCDFAPFCGDGVTQKQYGEQCDGTSQCAPNCTSNGIE